MTQEDTFAASVPPAPANARSPDAAGHADDTVADRLFALTGGEDGSAATDGELLHLLKIAEREARIPLAAVAAIAEVLACLYCAGTGADEGGGVAAGGRYVEL